MIKKFFLFLTLILTALFTVTGCEDKEAKATIAQQTQTIAQLTEENTQLRAEKEKAERDSELENQRRSQIGNADRSEKIRTYNYPQGRITDHRIGVSIYQMDNFLNGDLDDMIDNLIAADTAEKLKGNEE